MKPHVEQTIADLKAKIAKQHDELVTSKKMVDMLLQMEGEQPIYSDADLGTKDDISSIQRDQWYGQAISTAMREYLAMRRSSNLGPATVNAIYEALVQGGFKFDAKDEENAKRGVRISLTKNTSIFHRLPDGKHYGLADWYPEVKARNERQPEEGASANDDGDEESVATENPSTPKGGDGK